jgi:hypothetical protein
VVQGVFNKHGVPDLGQALVYDLVPGFDEDQPNFPKNTFNCF